MNRYYSFETEEGTERIFYLGFLQLRMKEAAKAGILYDAWLVSRRCSCSLYSFKLLNGIYGHKSLGPVFQS